MICTCFAEEDLHDLDLMHNFSLSAKKDLDDLDHDLSEERNPPARNEFIVYCLFSTSCAGRC